MTAPAERGALMRFARRLRDERSAINVLLFGPHARGNAHVDSDYDLIVVSPSFEGIPPIERSIGLRDLFYAEGGTAPLDLICLTPDEFDQAHQTISLVSAVLPEAIDLLAEVDSRVKMTSRGPARRSVTPQSRPSVPIQPSLYKFAEQLEKSLGATRVLLFGSHARGNAHVDSDYDLIVVSPSFEGIPPIERSIGLRDLFYAEGGTAPLDLICLTPDEFDQAHQTISLVSAVLPEAIDLLAREEEETLAQGGKD